MTLCIASTAGAHADANDAAAASAALVNKINHAWSDSDAAALARNFASDGDLITPDGIVSRGTTEIQGFYAAAFARGYKGSTADGKIERVRVLAPDLALIDATWSIDGAHMADGAPRTPEHGTLVAVMGLRDGVWKILALRESNSASRFIPLASLPPQ